MWSLSSVLPAVTSITSPASCDLYQYCQLWPLSPVLPAVISQSCQLWPLSPVLPDVTSIRPASCDLYHQSCQLLPPLPALTAMFSIYSAHNLHDNLLADSCDVSAISDLLWSDYYIIRFLWFRDADIHSDLCIHTVIFIMDGAPFRLSTQSHLIQLSNTSMDCDNRYILHHTISNETKNTDNNINFGP